MLVLVLVLVLLLMMLRRDAMRCDVRIKAKKMTVTEWESPRELRLKSGKRKS